MKRSNGPNVTVTRVVHSITIGSKTKHFEYVTEMTQLVTVISCVSFITTWESAHADA